MTEPIAAYTFLTELYPPDAPGMLPLFLLPGRRTFWRPPSQVRQLLVEAKPYVDTHDIYFGIGLHAQAAATGRGDETDVLAIPALWCDLDIADPVHRVASLPPDLPAAQQLLAQACPFAPSVLMHSGHGLQAYWLFRELWTLENPAERTEAKALCQRLQQSVQEGARTHGWHVDSTFDLARVFRLPGTWNRKAAPIRVECLAWDPQRRYSPSEFDALLPARSMVIPLAVPEPPPDTPLPPLHMLRLSVRLKYLLKVGEDPIAPRRYPSRSEALFAVLSALVGAGYADGEIVGVLLDPTYALSDKPRERGEHWLRQELLRVRTKPMPVPATTPTPPAETPGPRVWEEPPSDAMALTLLQEMIVSDPAWIQACAPARQKMWALAQTSPAARARLLTALLRARINPARFWETLATEMQEGRPDA